VGLRDGVEDAEYLALLSAELDVIWLQFQPDFVFYQAGVDPLAGDRLGRLRLTLDGLRQRDELVLRRCRDAGTRAVVVLGGGYGKTLSDTVNAHAQTIRVAASLAR
jgi:acetoin utilization deacetylase AcuC-like enzyme